MTTDDRGTTVISVRAGAHRSVAPDSVALDVHLRGHGRSKAASRTAADAAWRRVTDALAAAGGTPAVAGDERADLSWRVRALHSHEEHDDRGRPTGRHDTSLGAVITLRRLDVLPVVEQAVVAVDEANLGGVSWLVDEDNAAWPAVRADAIRTALLRARDYATALGGEVVALDEVSDVGLLGAGAAGVPGSARADVGAFAAQSEDAGDGLRPVPQRISATIEARVRATVGELPA